MKTQNITSGIHHGDCCQLMQKIPNNHVDLILTDPPYLVNYKDRQGRIIANDVKRYWLIPAYKEMYRTLKPNAFCVTTYGWNSIDVFMNAWRKAGFYPVGHFVWVKPYASKTGMTQGKHEMAYLLAKGKPAMPEKPLSDVLSWKYAGNKYHPTQKPVNALKPLIENYSKPGDLVFDPFMGSGSIGITAWKSRRKFLGTEIDAGYFNIAKKRMNAYLYVQRQQSKQVTS